MTTIAYKDGIMVGDGQITRYESLIESTTCVKVRNIGGTLVGGAGNGTSIMKFFDWYADNVETAWAQTEYSNLNILPPEDLVEEDFQALVISPCGAAFEYIGTKNILPITEEYAAIGSGCVYAYPLMDAGLTAKEAVEGAIKRCPFSGGDLTEVTFEEEEEVTEEELRSMSHEDLLNLVLGVEKEGEFPADVDGSEKEVLETMFDGESVTIHGAGYNVYSATRDDLVWIANELNITHAHNIGTEKLRKRILDKLNKED